MGCTNEYLNTDTAPTVELKVFAERLVRFTLHHDFSFNEALHRDERYTGLLDEVFNDQTRKAILVLDGVYRTEAKKVFDGIEKENINIHWFIGHAVFNRVNFFSKGVDYRICLHFCVYLAILATYLYHHGIEGILDIAANSIAVMFSYIVQSDEMEPLDIVLQKYANLYHEREVFALDVHQIANEKHNASEMHAIDGLLLLNRANTIRRIESEIEGDHHQYANEIMDRHEIKENVITIQTFPFCGKSPTSSSEPTTRQMHLGNPHLDFTAIPGTSRDTNTAADYPCSSSQSTSATNLAFKRGVSNEWGESEHNSAKKVKTGYIFPNNPVVKNFQDINMDYNAISSDDSD